MIAFLVFVTVMIAFIVGSVCISMYLYARNWTEYLSGQQFVTLHQEGLIAEESGEQRRSQFDMGMGECVWRVAGVSLGVVAVVVVLVMMFFAVTF